MDEYALELNKVSQWFITVHTRRMKSDLQQVATGSTTDENLKYFVREHIYGRLQKIFSIFFIYLYFTFQRRVVDIHKNDP